MSWKWYAHLHLHSVCPDAPSAYQRHISLQTRRCRLNALCIIQKFIVGKDHVYDHPIINSFLVQQGPLQRLRAHWVGPIVRATLPQREDREVGQDYK